ncbi:GNAT family N-acetyltransferase [Streptomyces sp. NPDC059176]|uniref:GNAT family N-acetyltransferase n=1 Tax=unclassified Streptomyces TaxID=2593676 RepID=UPI0036792271
MTEPDGRPDGRPDGATAGRRRARRRDPGLPQARHRYQDRGGFTVEICRNERQFARVADAWQRLHRHCRTATAFQSHAWLYSWWLSYGVPGRLRIVLVRRGPVLVAAAPLMLVRKPFPALVPLGADITDYGDVLLDDHCAEEAARALAGALAETAGHAVIDLREVRTGGAAERLYAHWHGPRLRRADSACLELPGVPLDDLFARLPAPQARQARAGLGVLNALGIDQRPVPWEDVPVAVRTLVRLHRKGRKAAPEHVQLRFSMHLARAVREMARNGQARMTEFVLDETVIAVVLVLISPGLTCGYLYGTHPDLRESEADVAMMMLHTCAGQGTGRTVLSLPRQDGTNPYRWRPEVRTNHRYLLGCRRSVVLLWLRALRASVDGRPAGGERSARRPRHGAGARIP